MGHKTIELHKCAWSSLSFNEDYDCFLPSIVWLAFLDIMNYLINYRSDSAKHSVSLSWLMRSTAMIELSRLYKHLITKFKAMNRYFPKKKKEIKILSEFRF